MQNCGNCDRTYDQSGKIMEVGSKREEPLTTEEFAYMAAVLIHTLCEELLLPSYVESLLVLRGYTKEEAKAVTDEAYRRRLE